MPIHAEKGGVQWGSHGKVYHGKNAREKAEAQAAAAHAAGFRGDEGHSSYLPSPEPRADASKAQCAGVLFLREGRVLLLHRKDRDEWEGPGGHIEDGETAVQAAIRECAEETGLQIQVEPKEIAKTSSDTVDYTTFAVELNGDLPSLTLNHEHDEAAWFPVSQLPKSVHPGVEEALYAKAKQDARSYGPDHDNLNAAYDSGVLKRTDIHDMLHVGNDGTRILANRPISRLYRSLNRSDAKLPTETDVIERLKRGELDSPVRFGPLWLFRMRVTGTGIAYRPQHKEWVYRPPRFWLTKSMLRRVDGLPILAMHSDAAPVSGDEYHLRQIGILVHPWIDDQDIWGIAKVYDDNDASLIVNKFPSTSPSVTFGPDDPGEYVKLETGETLFIEPDPLYIDHLAVVPEGVWDKFDGPTGIHMDSLRANATGASPPYSWRK